MVGGRGRGVVSWLVVVVGGRGRSIWGSGGCVLGVEGWPEGMRLTLSWPEQGETDGLGRIWVLKFRAQGFKF